MLSSVIIATEYKSLIRKALIKIKYGLTYSILDELLTKTLKREKIESYLKSQTIDFCTEIPMHQFKQNQRGFNTASILANWINKNYKIGYLSTLKKVRQTHAQMHLSRNERILNVEDVFELQTNTSVKDKNILLLDDVTTTGTTLEKAAQVLKENGANKIIALTLAGL